MHPPPDEFTRLLYDVLVETGIKERAVIQSFDVRALQFARTHDQVELLSMLSFVSTTCQVKVFPSKRKHSEASAGKPVTKPQQGCWLISELITRTQQGRWIINLVSRLNRWLTH